MPFGLVKQTNRADGKSVFEYGYKKSDMDAARDQWEILSRKHAIKNAAKAFPPAPPKIDIFIPRVSMIERQAAIEKHDHGQPMTVINKTNGNFQIITDPPKFKPPTPVKRRQKIDLSVKKEIED